MKTTVLALSFMFILAASFGVRAQQWSPLGTGISGPEFEQSVVDRLVEIDGRVYACGYFNDAGGVPAWSIAYWVANHWDTHGPGVDSTVGVLDVVKFNDQIVAFFTWGGLELINYWNGEVWTNFPSTGLGIANFHTDAEVHNNQLFLAQDAEGLFQFNGSSWDKLPGSVLMESPRSLVSYKGDLYIGAKNGLFKYNGNEIQQLWGLGNIYGLRVFDNMLYMTGAYLGHVGADTMTGVAMYDGANVISLGKVFEVDTSEFSEVIYDVTKIGNRLVAGGDVHDSIFSYSRILIYSDDSWEVIGVADALVKSLVTVGNTVYVGGYFFNISGEPFSNVAALKLGVNKITGKVFLNMNDSCTFDQVDFPVRRNVVRATPGPVYALTDEDGNYSMFLDSGNYSVQATPPRFTVPECPPSGIHPISVPEAISALIDFGFKPVDDSVRVQPYLFSSRMVGGRRSPMVIVVANEGGVPAANISVRLELSPYLTLLSSDHPYQQLSAHEYLFTISSLPIQSSEMIILTDSVDVGSIGQFALSRVFSFGFGGIELEDFSEMEIVGPSDPNEKLVASHQLEGGGYVMQDTIDADDVLTYQIHFQNVGTAEAELVIVRDTISPYLDLSTFKMLSASHSYRAELSGSNIITWTFDNINLPDSTTDYEASMGGVRYRIAQTTGNTPGTVITNKAAIYFDFNPPVITNEAVSVIALPGSVTLAADETRISFAPNPARTTTTVTVDGHTGEIALVTFHNVLGEEVYTAPYSLPATIDLRELARGVYFVSLRLTDGQIYYGKILVE